MYGNFAYNTVKAMRQIRIPIERNLANVEWKHQLLTADHIFRNRLKITQASIARFNPGDFICVETFPRDEKDRARFALYQIGDKIKVHKKQPKASRRLPVTASNWEASTPKFVMEKQYFRVPIKDLLYKVNDNSSPSASLSTAFCDA